MIKTIASTFNTLRSVSANVALELTNSKDVLDNIKIIRDSGIFDLAFYQTQVREPCSSLSAAITHYLGRGVSQNLDLHPLFDSAFYKDTNRDIDFSLHNPLIHFITVGGREGRNPHPLFDVQFYINEYADVRRSTVNPLAHYINFGAAERRTPSTIFDPKKYRKKAQDADLRENLAKYRSNNRPIKFLRGVGVAKIQRNSALSAQLGPIISAEKNVSFLRRFKSKFLASDSKASQLSKYKALMKRRDNLLTYFLSEGVRKRIFPFPSFELLYELKPREQSNLSRHASNNKTQIRSKKVWRVIPRELNDYQSLPDKFIRFAKHGAKANLSQEKYELFKDLVQSLTIKKNTNSFMESENTIILVSHQANLSGAPLLLLQIARALTARGWECLLFLERLGEIEEEFSEVAHIINFHEAQGREKKCGQYLSLLFSDMRFKKPKISLLNSLETGAYAKAMQENGIKIISLVHELVDTYSSSFIEDVFKRSQRVIFPAKFVRDFAEKEVPNSLEESRLAIIPNALLEPEFGEYDQNEARKSLREEIKAVQNSLIVLGCGSPEMRKGMDLFVVAASLIFSKLKQDPEKFSGRPIHFVWVGADRIDPFSPHYYIDWDIRRGGLGANIHLLPSRKDLRAVFHGADVFALPSRKDPFPCVVHNAMAAKLPVVGFENAGGVPEMVANGGAKIVPYGDIPAFAQAIEDYLLNDEQRFLEGQLNAKLVNEKFNFDDYMLQIQKQIDLLISSSA